MENPKSGEKLSAADLLKLFEEQNKLTAEELKEGDDWRSKSDDDWDKLLAGVDKYIDAYKEEIRKKVKKQMEAAQKAAIEADSEMRSTAAQEAALSVAASGFEAFYFSLISEKISEPVAKSKPACNQSCIKRKLCNNSLLFSAYRLLIW